MNKTMATTTLTIMQTRKLALYRDLDPLDQQLARLEKLRNLDGKSKSHHIVLNTQDGDSAGSTGGSHGFRRGPP